MYQYHFWLSLRIDKVFGFLEVVVKSGRSETNSGSGAASIDYRPWEEVHKSLSHAMKERLAPYKTILKEPHQIRGTFEECLFKARIVSRDNIDRDPQRRTCKVTIDLSDSGVTFSPGDRVLIMPKNNGSDIEKMVRALNLFQVLDLPIPLNETWKNYLRHMTNVSQGNWPTYLSAQDILLNGVLAPISKELVLKVTKDGKTFD